MNVQRRPHRRITVWPSGFRRSHHGLLWKIASPGNTETPNVVDPSRLHHGDALGSGLSYFNLRFPISLFVVCERVACKLRTSRCCSYLSSRVRQFLLGTVTDTGSGCSTKTAAYAVKDEYREVQPTGPVTLGVGGTYSFTVWLQASRLGTGLDGRLYTVTVSVSNNAGKTGSQAATVIVPHERGIMKPASE